MLPNLRVASPCSADWNKMKGNERIRYCPACNLHVYDFSAMPATDIERLIANQEGRLCARLYRRTDGTILTSDCPVGFRARVQKISLIAGTAVSALLGIGVAKAQSSPRPSSQLVQISDQSQRGILVRVVDATGAVIPDARIAITNTAKKLVREGRTDANGQFQVSDLADGSYAVTVNAFGFRRVEILDVGVTSSGVADTLVRLQVAMDVGLMGEIVSVDVQLENPQPTPDFALAAAPAHATIHKSGPLKRLLSRIKNKLQ